MATYKTYNTILVEVEDNTAIITINRAPKLNALNKDTLQELHEVLNLCAADSAIRGLILTGAGTKAFVAGADIQEFAGMPGEEAAQLAARGQKEVMDKIAAYEKPILAAINGFALGGGLELALAAHMRIASTTAVMGLPEVSLGLIPGYGGTQRLTQLVGRGKALEMILTGDSITATDALQVGLVNYVVEQEQLIDKCKQLLARMYLRSPYAIGAAIQAVNAGLIDPIGGFQEEIKLFGRCFDNVEGKEGIQAFLEKRKPRF